MFQVRSQRGFWTDLIEYLIDGATILTGFVRVFMTCEAVVWMSVHCAANVTFVRKNGPDTVNVSYGLMGDSVC